MTPATDEHEVLLPNCTDRRCGRSDLPNGMRPVEWLRVASPGRERVHERPRPDGAQSRLATDRRKPRLPSAARSSSRWPHPPHGGSTGGGSSPTTASVVRRCICSSTYLRPSRCTTSPPTPSSQRRTASASGRCRADWFASISPDPPFLPTFRRPSLWPWPESTPSTRRRGTSSSSSAPARDCSPWSWARTGRTGGSAVRGSRARRSTPPRSTAAAVAPGSWSAPPAPIGDRPSTAPTTSAPRGWSPTRPRWPSPTTPARRWRGCGSCNRPAPPSPTSSTPASSRPRSSGPTTAASRSS